MNSAKDTIRPSVAMDDLLTAVADPQRRHLLSYLSSSSETHWSVAELVEHLHSRSDDAGLPKHHLRQQLHHVHLPKLMDYGLITYDPESKVVQYTERPRVESLLSHVSSLIEPAAAEISNEQGE